MASLLASERAACTRVDAGEGVVVHLVRVRVRVRVRVSGER